MHKNKGLKTFSKFIEPSFLELLCVLSAFGVLVIANQVHHLYSADLTTVDAATFKGTFLGGFSHWLSRLYNSKDLSIVAVYIFWLSIASIVYVLAFRLTKDANEIAQDF